MSTPVHYDVDQVLADMRAGWTNFKLSADAAPFEKLALAHRDVFALMVKMTLQSENEGYSNIDVLKAGEMLLADWLVFMMSAYDGEDRQMAMLSAFLTNVGNGVLARKATRRPDQTTKIGAAVGGHA